MRADQRRALEEGRRTSRVLGACLALVLFVAGAGVTYALLLVLAEAHP